VIVECQSVFTTCIPQASTMMLIAIIAMSFSVYRREIPCSSCRLSLKTTGLREEAFCTQSRIISTSFRACFYGHLPEDDDNTLTGECLPEAPYIINRLGKKAIDKLGKNRSAQTILASTTHSSNFVFTGFQALKGPPIDHTGSMLHQN